MDESPLGNGSNALVFDTPTIQSNTGVKNAGDKRTAAAANLINLDVIKNNKSRPSDLGSLIVKPNIKNYGVWKHFKVYSNWKRLANCLLCKKDVDLGESGATGHLTTHIKNNHAELCREVLAASETEKLANDVEQVEKLKSRNKLQGQKQIDSIFSAAPCCISFPAASMDWMIGTYQPNSMLQNPFFRAMQISLNPKSAFIGIIL